MQSKEQMRETVKALALIHGQTRASEITGINLNTVKTWARRGKWKTKETENHKSQIQQKRAQKSLNQIETISGSSIAESYRDKLNTLKMAAELNLARYNASATEQAKRSKEKLRITQEAKDLSVIHRNLFPVVPEQKQSLVQLNVLVGKDSPERV